jgi:regulator of protease activity HflC (stomatin/prohibitin superfamily)
MALKRVIKPLAIAAAAVVLIVVFNPFTIIGATDRGVSYFLGAAGDEVIQPGLATHIPVIGAIRTWSIKPKEFKVKIAIDSNGAISKDNQIIGVESTIYWKFDEARILDIAKQYSEETLKQIIESSAITSIKTIIGGYTIFDLAQNQANISENVMQRLTSTLSQYPVILTQLNVSNFDWSGDFDKQINATMEAAQAVKKATEEANIAEQQSRKQVIEAEAGAKAKLATAQADADQQKIAADAALYRSQKEAEARIAEGQGIAEYNRLIAVNQQIEIRMRELEIELERAKRWNGVEVSQYIPLTAAGGVVTLPSP